MNILALLMEDLNSTNADALASLRLGDGTCLEEELAQLTSWLGGGAGLDAPTDDRIVAALDSYFSEEMFESLGQARLVCYGCTLPFGNAGTRLIEVPKLFTKFLQQIDDYHGQPRPFRRCYRGLLNGYFSYDPDGNYSTAEGRAGWRSLREYLDKRKNCLATAGFNPDWISAIADNPHLLSQEPCKPYGLAALQGDRIAFDAIQARLEIGGDSWLVHHLVHAQVDAAIGLPDTKFKATIDILLELLGERHERNARLKYELLVDECLGKILNRYADCSITDLNAPLRDFSVAQWKNPWLTSNAARWGSVRREARDMVGGWLKLKLISQFFALLAEDGSNDTRRVEFWKQYHEEIEDMYFALGNSAMNNRSKDFKEIRNAMDGRLLRLYAAGAPTNNAFIMMIGEYTVVEFGTSGNAAYIFNRNRGLPFELHANGYVAGNREGLKSQTPGVFVDRLVHNDTNGGSWEHRFKEILRRKVGLHSASNNLTLPPNSPASEQRRGMKVGFGQKPFSMGALREFAAEHGLLIMDNRPSGGALWVSRSRVLTEDAQKQLDIWGFRWSAKRTSYYQEQ